MAKPNSARLLETRGIAHEVRVYDVAGAFHSADEAAVLLGVPPSAVFKTLVVLRERPGTRPLLVLMPSTRQLDLKHVARAIGDKRLRMATRAEAERLTGLEVGGISALAVRRGAFEVWLDASARSLERIHVSAGVRGMDLALAPADLVAVTGAKWLEATSTAEDA